MDAELSHVGDERLLEELGPGRNSRILRHLLFDINPGDRVQGSLHLEHVHRYVAKRFSRRCIGLYARIHKTQRLFGGRVKEGHVHVFHALVPVTHKSLTWDSLAHTLEFHLYRLLCRCGLAFVKFEEFHLPKFEHVADDVTRELLKSGVEIADVGVVKAPGRLDLVLSV